MFALLLDFAFISIVVIILVTQVLIPVVMGTKLFPYFRKATNKLVDELREVNTQLEEKQLKDEIKEKRKLLKKESDNAK